MFDDSYILLATLAAAGERCQGGCQPASEPASQPNQPNPCPQIRLSQKFYRKQRVIFDGKTHALVNMRLPKGSLVWQGVVIPKLTIVKKAQKSRMYRAKCDPYIFPKIQMDLILVYHGSWLCQQKFAFTSLLGCRMGLPSALPKTRSSTSGHAKTRTPK